MGEIECNQTRKIARVLLETNFNSVAPLGQSLFEPNTANPSEIAL